MEWRLQEHRSMSSTTRKHSSGNVVFRCDNNDHAFSFRYSEGEGMIFLMRKTAVCAMRHTCYDYSNRMLLVGDMCEMRKLGAINTMRHTMKVNALISRNSSQLNSTGTALT